MTDSDAFSRDISQAVADVFRLYVGQGKRFSMAALSDATSIPLGTLKTYVNGEVSLSLANALRLVTVLPVEASNMILRCTGFKLAPIDAEEDDWDAIGAEASMLTFEIFEAKADGKIDHRERAKLQSRARALTAKLDGATA